MKKAVKWHTFRACVEKTQNLFSASAHRNLCGHPYFAASGWKILLGSVYFSLCARCQRTKRSLSLLLARIYTHIGGEADWLMRVSHSRTKSLCCAYQNRALFIPARPSHTHSLCFGLQRADQARAALQALPNANKSPNLKPFATRASTAAACNAPSFLFLKQPSAL
jgi:hypothetical protein